MQFNNDYVLHFSLLVFDVWLTSKRFFFFILTSRHVCFFKRWEEISRNGSAWTVCSIVSYRDVVFKPASPSIKILNAMRRIRIILNAFSGTLMRYNMQRFIIIMTKGKFFNIFFTRFIRVTRVYFEQVTENLTTISR